MFKLKAPIPIFPFVLDAYIHFMYLVAGDKFLNVSGTVTAFVNGFHSSHCTVELSYN